MGQTTVLAATTAAGKSSDIVVAADAEITVGAEVAGGRIRGLFAATIERKGVSGYQALGAAQLTADQTAVVLGGPGTYRVSKTASAQAIAIVTDDGL